ncbi:AAA domain-containing protein [Muribaculum intestinale]|uniref:DNA2/NAM7 helicase helicase domain-containing protein n=1 Tax=Muribaculum intestinale TaxID=1796646 RepID=A0A1B1S8X6_9BACT|nr:AAA domain-containing protein [Muribaculum intestinale]ANU63245.1 hypothetical protein A4V02_05590 [Muribaculum intestinale]ASB38675.1 hypothetical protein ADH68_12180 [Muribaculum intestinale]PWB00076.1 hypothetical protein C5O29_12720 [Muribaculum intestinale]PWB06543.1 hypothetical protein C5O72_13380 [Muribaculum intestinale]QQR09418.1 AAA family ATPase [Muribaculum intestinale]
MNLENHIIIINGADKTYQVESIRLDGYKYAIKFQNTDKIYSYSRDNILWLSNPTSIDFENCHVFANGKKEKNIKAIHLFANNAVRYYAITYGSDFVKHYSGNEVDIHRSCLTGKATNVFDYLQQCAAINTLGINEEDESSEGILSSVYSKISFVDEETAAAVYMSPGRGLRRYSNDTALFPFGCNASQMRAVNIALTNQISVIQGPPGTGKTQTILNIIANLLKDKKSVLVVSNNNSATENVLEKLYKNGLDFLVASLGKKENKEAFIANQPPLNSDLPTWHKTSIETNRAHREVKDSVEKVEEIFTMQERLAVCRQELAEIEIEMSHYKKEQPDKFSNKEVKTSSSKILKILGRIKSFSIKYQHDSKDFVQRFKRLWSKFSLELRLRLSFDIKGELTPDSMPRIISLLDWLFYIRRVHELKSEIENLETQLRRFNWQVQN